MLGSGMEETELEEGEALSYHGEVENSNIDPEIALSYIGEKVQNVLGHFQKDFEHDDLSAENLGAKFGNYGSFLPTYRRSPSWPNTIGSSEVQNYDTSRSSKELQSEDRRKNLLASSSASLIARHGDSSCRTLPMGNSLKGNAHYSFRHIDEPSFKCGAIENSVNPSDQRTLKVRIKVGSELFLNQKNAEIYSGLGLVVSPSSSLDDGPATGERLSNNFLDIPEGSPTSILQIMTSFHTGHLLSPLSEDLIYLEEKLKLRIDSESTHVNMKSIGNGSVFSMSDKKELEKKKCKSSENNEKYIGDLNGLVSALKKENKTEIDTVSSDELVSNSLKLPFLSNSQYTFSDTVKDLSTANVVLLNASKNGAKLETGEIEKRHFDSELGQDISKVVKMGERLGSTGDRSEIIKRNFVDNSATSANDDALIVEKTHASDQSNSSKGRKSRDALLTDLSKQFTVQKQGSGSAECLQSDFEKSSSVDQKKPKNTNCIGPQGSYVQQDLSVIDASLSPKSGKISNAIVTKNGSCDLQNYPEISRDMHLKDFFEQLGTEDGNDAISTDAERSKDPQLVGKRGTSEYINGPKEKRNGKSAEKYHPSGNDFRLAHMEVPYGNVSNSEAPTGMAPMVKEDWVSCDKCKRWRLLPLGTNPKSLPKRWRCGMLTWLPGMNSCSISEEETTSAFRALYHTSDVVPAPDSMRQHNQLQICMGADATGSTVDAQQKIAILCKTSSEKKKHGIAHSENPSDVDGSSHSSNSRKNLSTSGKTSKQNRGNHSPLYASECENMHKSNNEAEKQKNNNDNKDLVAHRSDTGTNLNARRKLDCDLEASRPSKRTKEDGHSEDEKWSSENHGASLKAGNTSANGLSNNTSGSDRHLHSKSKNSEGSTKKNIACALNAEISVPSTSNNHFIGSKKIDDKDYVKRRSGKEHHDSQVQSRLLPTLRQNHQSSGYFVDERCELDQRKKKKARVSKSGVKNESESIFGDGINANVRSMNAERNLQYVCNSQVEDCFKSERSSVPPSDAAQSSSSKVSSTRKIVCEEKGSPVESVSSSPLRLHNTDKVTPAHENLVGKDGFQDSNSLTAVTPRRFSGGENEQTRTVREDASLIINNLVREIYSDSLQEENKVAIEKCPSEQCQIVGKTISDHAQHLLSHPQKLGKGMSSYSNDKTLTSKSDLDKDEIKAFGSSYDYSDHTHLCKENNKSRKEKFNEKCSTPFMTEKLIGKKDTGGTSSEISKGRNQNSRCYDGQDICKSQDKDHNLFQEHGKEKLIKSSSLVETNKNGTDHLLAPLSSVRAETVSSLPHVFGSEKENHTKDLLVDTLRNGDVSKAQIKRAESQKGRLLNSRHSTPNPHKVRDVDASSPVRRDSTTHVANSALKEAKDLKHLADRLKNSGSTESNVLYFQASLKFLHGASLLEIGSSEGSKNNDLTHSMRIYSSTAKLCEFCAHEFEKSKDMAGAALAYKCMEVAYMRVVYSSHSNTSKDRNELQNALQIVPPGESPFSSASDVDNLNQVTADKSTTVNKSIGSPQVSGSQIISSQNRSGFVRLLNFAQDINLAMEASRKSRNAFTAAVSKLEETEISTLKKALDFNFQDVEGLLRLVRVSMEAINR